VARRTKEEAEKTRSAILDAAEKVFMEAGVSRASLHQIALAAGVTRGAVYWHFRDKLALIHGMADRVLLPEENFLDTLIARDSATPLEDLFKVVTEALGRITTDPQHRRVMTILSTRCEYIDEMKFLSERQAECIERILSRFTRVMEKAKKLGQLASVWTPSGAAYALHALLTGLVATDIKSGGEPSFRKHMKPVMQGFFAGLRSAAA